MKDLLIRIVTVLCSLYFLSCSPALITTENPGAGSKEIVSLITIYVATNGNDSSIGTNSAQPMLTIQNAINRALSLVTAHTNKICVAEGVYYPGAGLNPTGAGILIDNSYVYLAGGYTADFSNQSGKSELNGTNQSVHIIRLTGVSNVVIERFIIENAAPTAENGGGVLFASSSLNRIVNCVVSNNRSTNSSGGGIYINGNYNLVSNTLIANNFASIRGGGAEIGSGSLGNQILDCVISNNVANLYGGGLSILGNYSSNNSLIITNRATNSGNGGGLYLNASYCVLTGTYCYNRVPLTSSYGGGICFWGGSGNFVNNVSVFSNSAYNGGGIYCAAVSNQFSGTIINNTAVNYGSAIYINADSCSLVNMVLTNNFSTNARGCVAFANLSSLIVSGCIIGCGNVNDYGIYEVNAIINHTLSNNVFLTNSMTGVYYDSSLGAIPSANWANINDTNYTGAAFASGNLATNF